MFHRGSLQAPLRRIPDFYLTVEKSATDEVQQDAKLDHANDFINVHRSVEPPLQGRENFDHGLHRFHGSISRRKL
jgi:hypothetical protein